MKNLIKKPLTYLGVYEYLKYSRIFFAYEALFKPVAKQAFEKEYHFYRSFLSKGDLIYDIGANDGHKTAVFLHLADKVVCCEPDVQNFKTLRIRFRNHKKRVFIENVALAATAGTADMFIHHKGSAFNTLNKKFKQVTEADNIEKWNEKIVFTEKVKVPTITLDHLIKKYGKPYFIKIDVEGYELEVIGGLHQAIPFISIECLFPEFKTELDQIIEHLLTINKILFFNIAVDEQLIFPDFQNKTYLDNYLHSNTVIHFETIIKMPL